MQCRLTGSCAACVVLWGQILSLGQQLLGEVRGEHPSFAIEKAFPPSLLHLSEQTHTETVLSTTNKQEKKCNVTRMVMQYSPLPEHQQHLRSSILAHLHSAERS